jgi:hypothetical protein
MTGIIFGIAYILLLCEILWYFTCTEHEEVPLILVLLGILFVSIPGLHVLMVFLNPVILLGLYNDNYIELKDNWFNRKFLAYRG